MPRPTSFSVSTEAASKEPSPPGSTPIVRNSDEIMKLAKTPLTAGTCDTERADERPHRRGVEEE